MTMTANVWCHLIWLTQILLQKLWRKMLVWRRHSGQLKNGCVVKTDILGGGNVTIWGGINYNQTTHERINIMNVQYCMCNVLRGFVALERINHIYMWCFLTETTWQCSNGHPLSCYICGRTLDVVSPEVLNDKISINWKTHCCKSVVGPHKLLRLIAYIR